MTFYTLVIGDEGQEISDERCEEILAWLEGDENFNNELEDFHESSMNGYTKWYEHEQDMLRLSRTFPEVLFVLWGEGEEPEDLWKCYYLGGRVQEAPASVEYPSFDPNELVNPDADPPTRSQDDEDEKLTLSSAELAAFFKAAAEAENCFEALFIVGALSGPRPQELLGLKWPDFTLPDALGTPGEMRLVRKVSMSSEGLKIVESLKGSKGRKKKRRTVYLLPEAVAALKAHRRRYLEERMRRAEKWEETWAKEPKARDLVFPSETGGPMNRNNLLKRDFKPLAKAAGLPGEATLYTLRHTFATLWLESGENPKVLQEILGHSRIDVTLNVYSHVLPHIQQDAMDRFGQRFFGPSGSS